MSRLTRDGTAEPVSRDQIQGANADREIFVFLLQVTTSRIGNLTRLIHTLAICVIIHAYSIVPRVYSIVCCCCCPNERRAAAERSEPFSETLRVHSTERTGWEEGERVDRLRPERHPGVWHNGGLESDGVKG